jgi:hypothetical protein
MMTKRATETQHQSRAKEECSKKRVHSMYERRYEAKDRGEADEENDRSSKDTDI